MEIRQLFVELENSTIKLGIWINQEKTKIYDSGKENHFKTK
jgi:flagellar biosynthesis regulator FlaF